MISALPMAEEMPTDEKEHKVPHHRVTDLTCRLKYKNYLIF
jgi:hypothetical protein